MCVVCVFSPVWRWCCCGQRVTSSRPPILWWMKAQLSSGCAVQSRSWSTWSSCSRFCSTAKTDEPSWAEPFNKLSWNVDRIVRGGIKYQKRTRNNQSHYRLFQCSTQNILFHIKFHKYPTSLPPSAIKPIYFFKFSLKETFLASSIKHWYQMAFALNIIQ